MQRTERLVWNEIYHEEIVSQNRKWSEIKWSEIFTEK